MTTTLDLSYFIQTKAQAGDFSTRLAALSEKIYETNFDLEKAVLELYGLRKKDKFMALLQDQKVNMESHTALKKFLEQLQQQIAALPILTLTLALEPKEQTLKMLAEWFVLNINQQVLFDINVDPHLIAGASISFKGKNTDLSIRPKFEHIIQELLNKNTTKVQLENKTA